MLDVFFHKIFKDPPFLSLSLLLFSLSVSQPARQFDSENGSFFLILKSLKKFKKYYKNE